MSVGAIKAGEAVVSMGLDMSGLKTGLVTASARLKAFGAGVMTAGASIAAIGVGASLPFWGAIQAASNAAETLNKFQAVFGDQADAADAFASRLGGSIGRGVTEIRDGMSAFQAQMVGLGFGAEQAREMSQELTGLVYDFGSFFNVSDDEALGRFISAMSGSGEVLDRFGVNIKAAALDAEFLAMGLQTTTANATEQQKALARFNIIRRTLGAQGAVGDALKTADSFANTMKRVKAQLLDTAIAIGEAVLPAATWMVGIISAGIGIVSDFAKENKGLFAILAYVAVGITAFGITLAGLGAAIYGAGIAFGVLATAVSAATFVWGLLNSQIGLTLLAIGSVGIAVAGLVFALSWAIGFFPTLSEVGERAFGSLADSASVAFGGISAALNGGNFAMAASIAWESLKLVWTQGVNWVRGSWFALRNVTLDVWDSLMGSISEGVVTAMATVANIMANTATGLQGVWITVASFIESTIQRAVTSARVLWAEAQEFMGLAAPGLADSERRLGTAQQARIASSENSQLADVGQEASIAQMQRDIGLAADLRAVLAGNGAAGRGAELQVEQGRAVGEENEIADYLADLRAYAEFLAPVTATVAVPGAAPQQTNNNQQSQAGSSVGTFSSAAIQGMLGSGTPIDRVANIAEQQRILQQQMLAVQQQQLQAFQQGQQWGN